MTDIIIVKLNDKEYPTYIDEYGVQRFVPNPVVSRLLDKIGDTYDKFGYMRFGEMGLYGLNDIARDFYSDQFTVEDMLDFYTQINYSVSGMLDLSFFENVTVENPLRK